MRSTDCLQLLVLVDRYLRQPDSPQPREITVEDLQTRLVDSLPDYLLSILRIRTEHA